ncbi:TauD/TfdA family dioxygenase [Pseudomonas costantinii]|uniref:Iron hydroxylase n=1 Tax=Pseudomonas costantinii TaxID=168469 RepID=A0A1S2UDU2_9PSED|nr:TauD/TfdA family dioxygenase [Pseudomonas costantinii]NVZ18721.1 TauD/TfdA family dioxygenase [Pseudomonas costantinii]NVZ67538.1 TauD/TfdA family dioxygenase [Pseudomonas costantinii]OIN44409.1 iron hydroxylase [Pseudomonas costantinii]SED16273.1 Taurine catabolism dioxygenase TauD, TfdA family [Pseudomonas costantinii]
MPNFNQLLSSSIQQAKLDQATESDILNFRLFGNKKGFLHLKNLPIGMIPPTPNDRASLHKECTISEQIILKATAMLGDPIGYIQESNGDIINNFFPHKKYSKGINSDSYDCELELHTENAFHAVSPDYLVLLCLRQDPGAEAATFISSIDGIRDIITPEDLNYFHEEKYNFLSDYCATEKNCRIDINQKQTVLYGDPESPCFRFDPQFMVARSKHAQLKLELLRKAAWEVAHPVHLNAGDLLIIDNRKTAHARSAFSASLDGRDRWIQRTFAVAGYRYYAQRLGNNKRVLDLVTTL